MFLAHIVLALSLGKVTGHYFIALLGAWAPDIDHLWVYVKHGTYGRKLWKLVSDEKDPFCQRNILHNVFVFLFLSGVVFVLNFGLGIVFFLGYLSHIALDLLDSAETRPFYPYGPVVRGPIPYMGWPEWLFTALLVVVFFLI